MSFTLWSTADRPLPGASTRRQNPASTTIVSTYRQQPNELVWDDAARPQELQLALQRVGKTQEGSAAAQAAEQVRPKIMAASAMKPRPLVIRRSNEPTASELKKAPPRPASRPMATLA